MAAALALPGSAMAATPLVSTGAPSGVTETSATLNGTVNPEGETTQYGFSYADGNSTWCTSGGTSGTSYGGAPTALGFTDSTSHSVSLFYPALAPGQSLCYLVYASNASGTASGSQVTFTTPNPVPVVTTGAASAITGTSATLNGTVNPEGKSGTSYQFEYDSTSSQWCQSGGATGSPGISSPSTALGFSDSTAHAVSTTISGGPGAALCFRLKASNANTSAVGATVNFTYTAAVVRTDPATEIVNGGATLNGTINSQGSQAFPQYFFEYGPSSSGFCTSGGTSNAGAVTAGLVSISFMDSSDHPVSARIPGGLTPSTTYCFRLFTSNQRGSLLTFTTGPPVTLAVHVTGEGAVFPKGGGSALINIDCGAGKAHSHCSVGLVQGTVVTLAAEPFMKEESPIPLARFAGWSGACSGAGTAPTCTVTMSGDETVGATFAPAGAALDGGSSPAAVNKALAAALIPSGPAAKIGAILKAGGYPAAFNAPGAGTAEIAWYQVSPGAHSARVQKQKPALVAMGTKTFTKAGKATIKIKLTAKGKALLKTIEKGHKLALTAKGSFTPKGGKKTSKQKSFTLKR